ncbi:undecaprenyl-diphosphate phosphatase [Boseongicola aestuarii]|uniref:Undecaprenyl-diphosphatase n=1 Tax=Boseongicola aestuarii TaxID=1470561 RepID=A0A238J2F6_9RHOB|nr:undecaprenyl-diphosphate phosphatase [Boseongicola aestuarii]SMX24888.1 Undecaprenyl-diphosphatase [Boseongicola aestuarii]
MPILHLILVAVIQGITEFLPVSSSGHLILLPNLTGMDDQGQVIDVAVHVGTLGAVVLYFWTDVKRVLLGLPKVVRRQIDDQNAWLALCLIIATIPVILVGLIFKLTGFDDTLRSVMVVGWMTLIFGLVLYWADQTGPTEKTAEHWGIKDAITMGLAQTLALIPGTSRSGITITAARRLGYARGDAARLAMLMSIPTILASGVLLGAEVAFTMDAAAAKDATIAVVFAFIMALAALAMMMRLLRSISFTPYVIYRVILGLVLLWIAYA